ncbi:MAG: Ig-like domain-containing protein [Brevinematales bacterium]|nr:Ig-like domain-containing protein [Brevinematales bacterium]
MKKILRLLITMVIAAGIFEACGGASMSYMPSPSGYFYNDFFRICGGYSNSTVFAPTFTVWGDITLTNYEAYISGVNIFIDGTAHAALVYNFKLICQIPTLSDGVHTIKIVGNNIDPYDYDYLAYSANFTVDSSLPVVQFDDPYPIVLINSNHYDVAGQINPIGGVTSLSIAVNGWTITNLTPASSWDCVINSLPEGVNVISARIGTGTLNNFMAATLVVADYTKPVITDTVPLHNAVSVSLTQDISVTFSENIQTANLPNLVQLQKIGVPVSATYTYNSNLNKVIINPSLPLEDGVTYTIFVSNAIKDIAGNNLISNNSYSFSTLLPPISPAPAFADTSLIPIFYPTNAAIGLSGFSPRLLWDTASLNWDAYKFFVLISTAPFQIVGSAVKNKADGVLYWTSDLPLGSDGNIDMLRDTYDIIAGVATTSTNYSFVGSQIYYVLIFGVDRDYHTKYSSPVLVFRW